MEWSQKIYGDADVPAEVITFQSLLKNAVDLQLRARTGAAAPVDEKTAFETILGSTKFSTKGTRTRLGTTKAANQREIDVIYTPYEGGGEDLSGIPDTEIARRAKAGDEAAITEARKVLSI